MFFDCAARSLPELEAKRGRSLAASHLKTQLRPEETEAFFQWQAVNQQLRKELGIQAVGECRLGVDRQVQDYVDRMGRAVAENMRLRQELVQVQMSLAERKLPLISLGLDGQMPSCTSKPALQKPDAGDLDEQLSETILGQIQGIIQGNIHIISGYDVEAKTWEGKIVVARERQRAAAKAAQCKKITTPEDSGSSPCSTCTPGDTESPSSWVTEEQTTARLPFTTHSGAEDLGKDSWQSDAELMQLEQECSRLQEAVQSELEGREQAKSQHLQELQINLEMHGDEVMHFRHLIEEKRQQAITQSNTHTEPSTLLQAEIEHLQDHLREMRNRGDQERAASDAKANQLRLELRTLQEEQHSIDAELQATSLEHDQVRFGCKPSRAVPDYLREPQKIQGEGLAKEVDRARQRTQLLDTKVDQLEIESQDLRQRAEMIFRRVSGNDSGDGAGSLELSARIAQLQELVARREADLHRTKSEEQLLQDELGTANQAMKTASLDFSVLKQKLRLWHSKTAV